MTSESTDAMLSSPDGDAGEAPDLPGDLTATSADVEEGL
jgi:hypothetical protein